MKGFTAAVLASVIANILTARAQRAGVVGALERQINPLPMGRYWIHIVGEDRIKEFNDLVKRNPIKIELSERDEPTTFESIVAPRPPREFVVFTTLGPVVWPADKLGFPNRAGVAPAPKIATQENPNVEPPSPSITPLLIAGGLIAAVMLGSKWRS